VFDIDGTICSLTNGNYGFAIPYTERIAKVNELYDSGHTIIFQTARGMGRSNNNIGYANRAFYEFTRNQLLDWGVKFHDLFLGKPSGDIYVDDKGIKDENFFKNELCP
tara:strand:- start:267 stop:590 length:324 start_codon:yes stop_codon:yes gene_type:complete